MYNWSTDVTRLQKNPEKWELFRLEQAVSFGLNGEKISATSLRENWNKLDLDPNKKKYLHMLLWPTS